MSGRDRDRCPGPGLKVQRQGYANAMGASSKKQLGGHEVARLGNLIMPLNKP